LSVRDIRYRTGLPSELIVATIAGLIKAEVVTEVKTLRTVKYRWRDIAADELTS
jgi:hypothetical protein